MASWPPKKNTAFTFYVSLVSQADTKIFQANPTLAAGDVKVAIDDGAPANLATLPVVDADFTKRVKVAMSASEMNGDRISIIFSDAAGAEWCDLTLDIPTSVRQVDDLATQASVDVIDDFLDTEIAAIKAKTDNLPTDPADQSLIIAATDAIIADTNDIQARLPAALVGGRIDASVGAIATDAITAAAVSAAAGNKIADHALRRSYANARASADGDVFNFRSLLGAIAKLVNKWSVSGTTLTVTHEDDVTTAGTQTVGTTVGAEPVTSLDTT